MKSLVCLYTSYMQLDCVWTRLIPQSSVHLVHVLCCITPITRKEPIPALIPLIVTPQPGYLYRSILIRVSRPVTVTTLFLFLSNLSLILLRKRTIFFSKYPELLLHTLIKITTRYYTNTESYTIIIQYFWTHNILDGYELDIRHLT